MSIGTNIKKRRFELRMSQQDLATAMGYKTRSTIAKIESDDNSVSYKKLLQFAKVLDTSIEELISGHDSTPAHSSKSSKGKTSHKRIAVILAGGKSTRNMQNIPNQFLSILGKPVIVYVMEAYQKHPAIDEILVVCLKGWEDILSSYAQQYNITKLTGIIPNGETGIQSVRNAVNFLSDSATFGDIIILQESTRPLVNQEIISKLLNVVIEKGSAVMAEPMNEYLQFMDFGTSSKYMDRNKLISLQSPEAYDFATLKEMFEKANTKQLPLSESCCALFMHNNGYKLNFAVCPSKNYKIVHSEDLAIVNALIKQIE